MKDFNSEENLEEKSSQEIPFILKLNNKYFHWGLTAFTVIAAGILFYYIVFHSHNLKANILSFFNVIMPIIYGFILAYLLSPILNYIEYHILIPLAGKMGIEESQKRSSLIRALGIAATDILFIALIYGLISMLVSQIVPSIINIVSNFDTYISNFSKWVTKLLEANPDLSKNAAYLIERYSVQLEEWLNTSVLTKTSGLIKTVSLSVIGALKILWNFIIGFIISIYLLASKEKFAGQSKKIVYACCTRTTANNTIKAFRFIHKTFIGFICGKVIDSVIIGLLCFIGTTILGTPYAALVSAVIGVTNIIPFFGPYLGAIPSALLVLVVDPSHPLNCLYFVIFILVLQQFDGNFLGPKILGDSTGLAGFWILFSITLFGGVFGILGMVVGVPIFAVIYAAVKLLTNMSLEKKKLSTDTDDYLDVGYIDEDGFHEYIPDYRIKKAGIKKIKNKLKKKAKG